MSNANQTSAPIKHVWNAPRLKRIGTIVDVAGNQTAGPQGGGTKS